MSRLVCLQVLGLMGLLGAPLAQAETMLSAAPNGALDCEVPAAITASIAPLPHAADALAHGRMDILAVGSATMQGPENAAVDASFPYRMAEALRAARPGVQVTIDVDSHRGLTAAEQLEKMRVGIKRHPYRLVIWQTGTVEAARRLSPSDFSDTIAAGDALARTAGADLLLVDPQYSRFLLATADVEPYQAVLRAAAARPDVVLFPRYNLMRDWVDDGRLDIERAKQKDRLAMVEKLHLCLGLALSRIVLAGVSRAN